MDASSLFLGLRRKSRLSNLLRNAMAMPPPSGQLQGIGQQAGYEVITVVREVNAIDEEPVVGLDGGRDHPAHVQVTYGELGGGGDLLLQFQDLGVFELRRLRPSTRPQEDGIRLAVAGSQLLHLLEELDAVEEGAVVSLQ